MVSPEVTFFPPWGPWGQQQSGVYADHWQAFISYNATHPPVPSNCRSWLGVKSKVLSTVLSCCLFADSDEVVL